MQDSIICVEYVMHAMWECGVCVWSGGAIRR